MDKTGPRPHQSTNTTANQGKFRLPPDVSFNKYPLPDGGWAYVFRHRDLGELGRVVVQERGEKNTHLLNLSKNWPRSFRLREFT